MENLNYSVIMPFFNEEKTLEYCSLKFIERRLCQRDYFG